MTDDEFAWTSLADGADFDIRQIGTTLTITFNRPAARNALNRATRVALVEVLDHAERSTDISAIILTGTGQAFSSGLDAKELLTDPNYVPPLRDSATRLREMSTPSIAAVNGACVSGALEIALGCSFMIASERATFRDTHAAIGLCPGWGLSAELPAAIGVARARQMTLTGLPIDARTALTWGLVNEVVEPDALLNRAEELAAAISAIPTRAATNAMELYRHGQDDLLNDARERERSTKAAWAIGSDAMDRFASGSAR